MGDPELAMTYIKESTDHKVENPQSYFLMSQLFEDKKDLKNAQAQLKKAIEKFPKNPVVFYQMGTLQDRMNLKNEMTASMKKVIELEPEHAQALNYLAYTWAEAGKELDLAESYARKAASKETGDAFILDTLGWVLFKKGKFKEAVDVLEKAHAMQPEVSIILEHLGDVYIKLNMHSKARLLFLKAAEGEDNTERKMEINSKLTQVESDLKSLRLPSSVEPGSGKDGSP